MTEATMALPPEHLVARFEAGGIIKLHYELWTYSTASLYVHNVALESSKEFHAIKMQLKDIQNSEYGIAYPLNGPGLHHVGLYSHLNTPVQISLHRDKAKDRL